MLALTKERIDVEAARRAILSPDCGALVEFTGVVRNLNQGREVTALEYEGAPELASSEFARIETEARASFAVAKIACVHRIGRLVPGEIAVWLGVTATHRDAAFAACQFAIHQLKQRVPVWKKEHYTTGDSGWINHP